MVDLRYFTCGEPMVPPSAAPPARPFLGQLKVFELEHKGFGFLCLQ